MLFYTVHKMIHTVLKYVAQAHFKDTLDVYEEFYLIKFERYVVGEGCV